MKLIAHRGLYNGPNKNRENHPDQIKDALSLGFDAEVDLWIIYGNLYLGHDEPQYSVDSTFISNSNFWIHAQNLDALFWLVGTKLNYFWHQEDDYVITSHHYIWTYPGKNLTEKSIMVMPEWKNTEFRNLNKDCFGICSDYVIKIRQTFYDQ